MPSREDKALEASWRALSNPIRRQMLDILREGRATTGELADSLPQISRFAVMQHLRVLEEGGLVAHVKEGRKRFNYLNPVPIQQIYDRWVSRYQMPWAESLVSLKRELEGEDARSRSPRGKRSS